MLIILQNFLLRIKKVSTFSGRYFKWHLLSLGYIFFDGNHFITFKLLRGFRYKLNGKLVIFCIISNINIKMAVVISVLSAFFHSSTSKRDVWYMGEIKSYSFCLRFYWTVDFYRGSFYYFCFSP